MTRGCFDRTREGYKMICLKIHQTHGKPWPQVQVMQVQVKSTVFNSIPQVCKYCSILWVHNYIYSLKTHEKKNCKKRKLCQVWAEMKTSKNVRQNKKNSQKLPLQRLCEPEHILLDNHEIKCHLVCYQLYHVMPSWRSCWWEESVVRWMMLMVQILNNMVWCWLCLALITIAYIWCMVEGLVKVANANDRAWGQHMNVIVVLFFFLLIYKKKRGEHGHSPVTSLTCRWYGWVTGTSSFMLAGPSFKAPWPLIALRV